MIHENQLSFIAHKAYKLRYWAIKMTSRAESGHPTSALSCADIVAVLFFYAMHYDPYNYTHPDNDRFILSKGHAAPVLYAAWKELGLLTQEEILAYRTFNSPLEGHPTPRFKYTDAATGSLGMGLSIGLGYALAAKLDGRLYKTYVIIGDSESTEGNIWEAVQIAVHYKLDNIVCFIDVNNLGQSTTTLFDYDIQRYKNIFTAFGWHVFTVDGHDIKELIKIVDQCNHQTKPVMIIAKTVKGYGVDFIQGHQGFHGKVFMQEQEKKALLHLKTMFSTISDYDESSYSFSPHTPRKTDKKQSQYESSFITLPNSLYTKKESVATRKAYGTALALLGDACPEVVCLDAEVKNSTYADIFEPVHPERFFQCFVAEQNMVAMAIGLSKQGKIPFVSTFSAFFSRAYDQIRMAAINNAALRLVGSHCGVSIGQDGPSQMGLEDLAMMQCIPNSIVLYPSDAVSTHKLVACMAQFNTGISYLRTTRMNTPVIYDNNEEFFIGGCKVLRQSPHDVLCVIAAGITLLEAINAYDILLRDKIHISLIDLYSIKPLDAATIESVAQTSNNTVLIVEDHYPQGGIADAIRRELINKNINIYSLSVSKLPRSGLPEELLAFQEIDTQSIVNCVKKLTSS